MKKLVAMVSIYNSGDWIENRLVNLFCSSMIDDIDIWCVNANSPDDRDDDIPRKFNVKYVKLNDRIDLYSTWNYIITESSGQYLTNANTDDIVSPVCYERLCNLLDNNCDIAHPSWCTTDVANQKWESLINVDYSGNPGNFAGNVDRATVGHFPMWKRSIHDNIGMFDKSFRALGDIEFWTRAYYAGYKFQWLNEYLGCYLWRNGMNLWHTSISDDEWVRYHNKAAEYSSQR